MRVEPTDTREEASLGTRREGEVSVAAVKKEVSGSEGRRTIQRGAKNDSVRSEATS